MRLIFGIVLGVGLTLGLAWWHDSNAPAGIGIPGLQPPAAIAGGRIVNWDVLGAVVRERSEALRREFDRITGR